MRYFLLFLFCSVVFFNGNAAEFFLKTEKPGYYSVTISDQTLITASNTFRFFDIAVGNHSVSVTDIYSGNVVYTGTVQLANGKRKVMRLDQAWRMFQVDEFTVSWTNWYTQSGTGSNSGNNQVGFGTGTSTSNFDFPAAKAQIDAEAFDQSKLEKAKSITSKVSLTSVQIAEICSLFSFDTSRLEYAKFAYDYCSDKPNYFKVGATMTFSSNKTELERYVKNH